jgi:peptidoglycan-N-acetylglucosamine deacetylase
VVALTFDDGPDAMWTPLVLDALHVAGPVAATFFVVAEQIDAPGGAELVAETLRRGHSVQMHCARHDRHELLNLPEVRSDARAIEDTLAANGVPDPALWRPPYGSVHPRHSCRVASERGRQLIRWSYDTVDYRGLSAPAMLERVLSGGLREDSIVLMHDSRRYSSTPEGGARGTVELIGPLVEHVRASGWDLGALTGRVSAAPPEQRGFLLPCAGSTVNLH